MTALPELIQFPYSHYNEKARWALDRKGVPRAARASRHRIAHGVRRRGSHARERRTARSSRASERRATDPGRRGGTEAALRAGMNVAQEMVYQETATAAVVIEPAAGVVERPAAPFRIPRRIPLAALGGAIAGVVFATVHLGLGAGAVWLAEALDLMAGFATIATMAALISTVPDYPQS
jgi:hypothetical protein